MTKEAKKLKARKVENPMKWMADDAFYAAVKDELQKFISSNDYIKVPKEYMSAVLLIAWHFAEWGKPQPSLPSNLDEAAEEYAYNNWEDNDYHTGASEGLPFDAIGHTEKCFKAGAEWMAQKEKSYSPWLAINGLKDAAIDFGEFAKAYEIGGQSFEEDMAVAFTRGAEWMAGQGVIKEAVIGMATEEISINVSEQTLNELDLCPGDKVVVQIRKK